MIVNRNPRNYEVSIWTLQDSFITVLKSPYLEHKGQIEEPSLSLKDDSEDTFSFRIPMYIRRGGEKIENPNWFNVRNGNLIADMRKLKVIFNKGEEEEQVFEFLITKVTEKHEGFETWCEVESEGLAFHELGKTGYKIELSSELFNIEYNDWLDNGGLEEEEPINNINYWIDKVLKNTLWEYEICMDWRGYADRESNKIYEDAYVSSWNIDADDNLIPGNVEKDTEKLRLVDGKEDNRFNLLQTIAETFGVYCKFEYSYDDNYHITNRKVIYYNNFFKENEEIFDLTYHYDTEDISREMDSTELVTKMIVLNQSSDDTENSITEVDANPLLEDYLLNFDYLYAIGAVTQEQYDEVKIYNKTIHKLNADIKSLSERIASYENILIHAQAMYENAKQALILDQEGKQEEESYIDYLLLKTEGAEAVEAKKLTITKDTAKPQYPIGGVVTPYNKYAYNIQVFVDKECTKEIPSKNLTFNKDDSQLFCTSVSGIPDKYNGDPITVVYLTYDYSPDLYHKYVYDQWVIKFNKDAGVMEKYKVIVETLNGKREEGTDELINKEEPGLIQECRNKLNTLLDDKEIEISKFENMMGPALREGTWQPEDSYGKYDERKQAELSFQNNQQGSNNEIQLIMDSKLFDEEETNYYTVGVNEDKIYYPCIDISEDLEKLQPCISNEVQTEEKTEGDQTTTITRQFGLILNDLETREIITTDSDGKIIKNSVTTDKYKLFSARYGFLKQEETFIPVLMITGIQEYYEAKNVTNVTFQDFVDNLNGVIGYLETSVSNDTSNTISQTVIPKIEKPKFLGDEQLTASSFAYPRIRIDSYKLKTSSDKLKISYNTDDLEVNRDYYILSKYNNEADETNIQWNTITVDSELPDYTYGYYITIRPEVLLRAGTLKGVFKLTYSLNNVGLMVYLDAIQILKENSMPKVSYSITPKLVKKSFIKNLYAYMHYLVHINDYELKFENVMGYISSIDLKLDTPWEDSIEIKNYKTKFEDLFTSIVASTEAMKKNSAAITYAATAFTATGNLTSKVLQNSISFADLNYAFNNGRLTINEKDGIWATSENGVVAFNGGGIFTATEKDSSGNWIWNTGILPRGISANAITAGQLNTNLIRIYAGDDLRFQMNGEGLFAYKSWLDDYVKVNDSDILDSAKTYNDRNPGQYVVHNSDGLFLIAEAGSKPIYERIQKQERQLKNDNKTISWPVSNSDGFVIESFIADSPLEKQVKRVEISWDGLKLSNWQGEPTFYADPDTGDLIIGGTLLQNSSFVTVSTEILESIENDYIKDENTTNRGLLKSISLRSENTEEQIKTFEDYVVEELVNDNDREEKDKHVRFLTPNVAAIKINDFVKYQSTYIADQMVHDALDVNGRITNHLQKVSNILQSFINDDYMPIIASITDLVNADLTSVTKVDSLPSDPQKYYSIQFNKETTIGDKTYKINTIYWYDGNKWNELNTTGISLGTNQELNLFGANATFAAGSELKMLAGGKLHLFGGEVWIASQEDVKNGVQTDNNDKITTPVTNGIVMDNEGLAIYSTKNITIGTQRFDKNNNSYIAGLEIDGSTGSFSVVTDAYNGADKTEKDAYKNAGINFYRIDANKQKVDAITINGNGIAIETDSTININSTNFEVHSNPNNKQPLFYVGDSLSQYIQYKNGQLNVKGSITADSLKINGLDANNYVTSHYNLIDEEWQNIARQFTCLEGSSTVYVPLIKDTNSFGKTNLKPGIHFTLQFDIKKSSNSNIDIYALYCDLKKIEEMSGGHYTTSYIQGTNSYYDAIRLFELTNTYQTFIYNFVVNEPVTHITTLSLNVNAASDSTLYIQNIKLYLGDTGIPLGGLSEIVDVHNGALGLAWEDSSGNQTIINNAGISIYGNGGYFKVDASKLGFYKRINNVDEALLYYNNGDVYLKGNIYLGGHFYRINEGNVSIEQDTIEQYFSNLATNNAEETLRNALSETIGGSGSIQGAITKRLNAITGDYTDKIKEVNNILKVAQNSGAELPNNPNNFDTFTPTAQITVGNNIYKPGYKYVYIEDDNNGGWQELSSPNLFFGASGQINMYSNSAFNLYSGANMTIASGGNMTIAAGGNMTIGAANGTAATLSLLSTGKLTAFGSEIAIATVEAKDDYDEGTGEPDTTSGSYLWMHDVNKGTENVPDWQKQLDIGTTGDFQILSGGTFSALAANEVLIATDQNFNKNSNTHDGSYIWMHSNGSDPILDIGSTGTLRFETRNLIIREGDAIGSDRVIFQVGQSGGNTGYLQMLRDGTVTVKGRIVAEAGKIGKWEITDGGLIYTPEINIDEQTDGTIYLGPEGLRIGTALVFEKETITIANNNGNEQVDNYTLTLDNVNFSETIKNKIKNLSNITKMSIEEFQTNNVLNNSEYNNGDLILVYSSATIENEQVVDTTKWSNSIAQPSAKDVVNSGDNTATINAGPFAGNSVYRWNASGKSVNSFDTVRCGTAHTKNNSCGVRIKLTWNSDPMVIKKGTTVKCHFQYKDKFNTGYDAINTNYARQGEHICILYSANYNDSNDPPNDYQVEAKNYQIYASTKWKHPKVGQKGSAYTETTEDGLIYFTITKDINLTSDMNLFLIMFCKTECSLMHIFINSISLSATAVTSNSYGLLLKSNDQWVSLGGNITPPVNTTSET